MRLSTALSKEEHVPMEKREQVCRDYMGMSYAEYRNLADKGEVTTSMMVSTVVKAITAGMKRGFDR